MSFFKGKTVRNLKLWKPKPQKHKTNTSIINFLTKNEIVHEQNIIAILKERTGLSDEEILDSPRRLIEKSKVLAVSCKITNKKFYRKDPFA
jgi:hypothetical protein